MNRIILLIFISCTLLSIKSIHDLDTSSSKSSYDGCFEMVVAPPLCKTEWVAQINRDFEVPQEGRRLKAYLRHSDPAIQRSRRLAHHKFSGLPESKGWVRRNVFILDKMVKNPSKQAALVSFYTTFTPNPRLPNGSSHPLARFPCIINGTQYNKYGFVKFKSESVAPLTFNKYFDQNLDGAVNSSKYDYESAAAWFVMKNPNAILATGGQGIVVNNIYYAMHHMEDGRTMMPIRADTPNANHNVPHTGGASIIRKNLQDVFTID